MGAAGSMLPQTRQVVAHEYSWMPMINKNYKFYFGLLDRPKNLIKLIRIALCAINLGREMN
jgi:uncharacterized Fe-S cluster-containing radical SAM superfamily enzyme